VKHTIALSIACVTFSAVCVAQQALPDAPSAVSTDRATQIYTPPTQGERFKTYARHTFGIYSIVEAGIRGGIDQARDTPSQWPEGGQGYADRFGSAIGQIAVRGTTEYLVSDLFREDLRFVPCADPCSESKLKRAFEDTFTARKGENGQREFSIARLVGPVAGGTIATTLWYPSGYGKAEIARQTAFSYAFGFLRNYFPELNH
jgi:hypothetical protein